MHPAKFNEILSRHFSNFIISRVTPTCNIYFLTITFAPAGGKSRRRADDLGQNGKFELAQFGRLYNFTARKLVGRNYNRPYLRDRQPTCIGFIDAENSRLWKTAGAMSNLHVHSVWVLDKADSEKFEAFVDFCGPEQDMWRSLDIDSIDVKRIESSSKRDIEQVIRYSSKLLGYNNALLEVGEDFVVYPQS